MIKYTIEIEYCHSVNYRDTVEVAAYDITHLADLVKNNYIGEDGKSARILKILKTEEI